MSQTAPSLGQEGICQNTGDVCRCVSVRAILEGISFFFFLENCFCSEDTWTVNYKTPVPKTSHILIEKGNKTHKSTQFSHCVKTKENIKN